MAYADDDDFDWGSRECIPSEDSACAEPCDVYNTFATCPSHAWACYPDRGSNGTAYGCDCAKYHGCHGPDCSDMSPTVFTFHVIAMITVLVLAIPTTFQSSRALYRVHKAGKLDWGAPTTCILFTAVASIFGFVYLFEEWVRKMLVCAQRIDDGGTNIVQWHILASTSSLFAMFTVLAITQILLMWIDVYIKSKTMQKVGSGNSLLDVYKKALRRGALVFAVVFAILFAKNSTWAVMWTFLSCILLVVTTPIGAMNLARMLTQSGGSDNCCAKLCAFAATGIPMAFCGKRSKERQHAWSSADSSSPAGKFVLTRLAMAEKVEKAGIWIWFGLMGYLVAGVGFLMFQPTTAANETGQLNVVHVCIYLIFMPINLVHRQMLLYCKYTLRDVLDPNRSSSRKVSAGVSVNSSTVAVDSDPEGSSA